MINNIMDNKQNKKIEKRINSIYDFIDPSVDNLFVKGKLLISARTAKEMREKLLQFEPPKRDIKAYNIRIKINRNKTENILSINCTQFTINKKLKLVNDDDDVFQTFIYSVDELIRYGFKLSHIKSMIKALKNNLISFEKPYISFTELKKSLEK